MRVLMITDFFPPFLGGVEVLVSTLSRELVGRGHEVAVATLAAPGLPTTEVIDGVHVHRVRTTAQRARFLFATPGRPWAPPTPDPEAVAGLRTVLRAARPDVVHGHDWLARSYLPLKRRSGPGLVMSLHYFTLTCPKKNLMFEGAPCSGPRLRKCVPCARSHYGDLKGLSVTLGQRVTSPLEAMLVDLFLPVSQATADGNGLGRAGLPYRVLPNAVSEATDEIAHESLLQSLPDEQFLLFVGDLRRDKGIHVLLAAYERLVGAPPLVLVGKVWPETPGSLPAGVHVFREWPNGAVRGAMRRCMALVAPSVWAEPFGIVVAEALDAGRPVIASGIGGIPEIARDGLEGLLVQPGDVGALTVAMQRVIDDPALRERLGANARLRAARFAPATIVPLLESAYDHVVAERSHARHDGGGDD